MPFGSLRSRLVIVFVAALALPYGFAEPYATVIEPPADFVDDPTCELENPLFPAPIPSTEDVPIPVLPGAIFAGATPPLEANANGVAYQVLPMVRLLTRSPIEDVVAFYAEVLDEAWSTYEFYGTHTYYLHAPVDNPLMLLLERPGAIASVEIGSIFVDCDAKLDPSATTFVTIQYPLE